MWKQQPIDLGADPYSSPYKTIGIEECENMYFELNVAAGAKTKFSYVSIPGSRIFTSKSNSNGCRGLHRTSSSRLFSVNSNKLIEILSNGQKIERGTITTYSGTVGLSDNTYQLILVDGQYGYILDLATNTFTKIDENTFQNGATHVTCIDTYFLVNRPNSIYYNWSKPNNGLIWDPLDFASKEGAPDNVVALKECNNQLWVFGSQSTEIHYNTGETATQVWQRYQSAIIDVGIASKYSVSRIGEKLLFVGIDNTGEIGVYMSNNITPAKVSNIGVEQIIQERGGDISNVVGMTYSQDGHSFYILQFMSTNLTLVFDITTGKWHTRNKIVDNRNGRIETKWQGIYTAYCFNKNVFGDFDSDALYWTDMNYYKNDLNDGTSTFILRTKSTPIQQSNQKRIRWNSIQVIFNAGSDGIPQGTNPLCGLTILENGQRTANATRYANIGRIGEIETRCRFVNLGTSRNRTFKIEVSEPVPVVLVGLIAEFEELRS